MIYRACEHARGEQTLMLNFWILNAKKAVKNLNHQFHFNGQTKSTLKSSVFCHGATEDHGDHDNKRLFESFHHVATLAVIHDRSVIVSRIWAQKDSNTDLEIKFSQDQSPKVSASIFLGAVSWNFSDFCFSFRVNNYALPVMTIDFGGHVG